MQREFSINILFLIGINLLIKPFFIFGIDRVVQNVVGTETYGVYFALLNFTYLLQIINDFGIQNFNNREIARHNQLIHKYFPNILALKGLLSLVFLLAVFLTGWLAGYSAAYFHLLFFLALNQIFISLIFFVRSNISGLGLYRVDSFLSATDKFLMIIFCGALIWTPVFRDNFQIEWFIYAQSAALLITVLIGFFILKNRVRVFSFQFRLPLLWIILKKSYPFALVILLMTIYTRIDAVMLERLLPDGSYHAGVYGAAYRFLDAANMIGFLFASLLLPMFSKMLKEGKSGASLVRHSFQMIWAGAITLSVAVYFYKNEIMDLLYHESNEYFGEVLGWLMFSFIAVAGSYIYGTLLTANGSLMKMNRIFIGSIVLNIVLNLWWIPLYQAQGAAIATLITQSLVFLAEAGLSQKEIKWLRTDPVLIFKMTAFFSLCFGFSWWLKTGGMFEWQTGFFVSAGFCMILAFLLKMLDFKSLFNENK